MENANTIPKIENFEPGRTLLAIFDEIDSERVDQRYECQTLANAAGINRHHYSYVKNRKRVLTGKTMQKIIVGAAVLGLIVLRKRDALAMEVHALSGVPPVFPPKDFNKT